MKVFLSYALPDQRWAHKLGSRLEVAGLDVWDPEREILPGDNWGVKLGEALARSDAMVVLISPDAIGSRAVRNEIEFALGSARFSGRLIPVVVRPTRKIPWILKELPLVHLKERGPAEVADQIAGLLKKGQAVAATGA
jgi:hypothetical protein